nr:nedd8-conjugating enzyme UbcE2M-like [Lytechinus pictus]
MASPERTIAKDFMALMKNIKSFSNGQAVVTKWDDKNLGNFEVTISPNDGCYKEGEFVFEIFMESCDDLPRLFCKTAIYHPNIDTIQDPDGEICINLFDVDMWNTNCSMQDLVQGLLFLMYNPNLEDPLCGAVNCSSMEEFEEDVQTAIAGGRVGDYLFPVNPRYNLQIYYYPVGK